MIDHKKIEDAIDSYFKNTPTAKIIENLDRHSADREQDLDRENINHKNANNKGSVIGNLVRFEEVSPANQDAAFLTVSIESLVAPLGLPLYEGYDDLDEMRLTFLTLPSEETVTLMEYLHSPQPGVCISVDAAMQNIPQVVFESCQQLQVSREEALWFHPDLQDEIDRLYAEHGAISKRQELPQVEEIQRQQYEPIDCFNHALRIYTREYVPATYWAMLQHNLGLAYQNRIQGNRGSNLEQSIDCFNKSLEIYTQNEFPKKWKISQDNLDKSERLFQSGLKQDLVMKISNRLVSDEQLPSVNLRGVNLSGVDLNSYNLSSAILINTLFNYSNLSGTNLCSADLRSARLGNANLSGANLSCANLTRADLRDANLTDSDLRNANLHEAILWGANFSNVDLEAT
jgi:uncharacterized protein YjbI with pentapeptide repeats